MASVAANLILQHVKIPSSHCSRLLLQSTPKSQAMSPTWRSGELTGMHVSLKLLGWPSPSWWKYESMTIDSLPLPVAFNSLLHADPLGRLFDV
jgi:hypothetical protein